MKYIVCDWKHDNPKFPIRIYSEVDEEGWEIRKVELFPDGRAGYADLERVDNGDTGLSELLLPSIEEINLIPSLRPKKSLKKNLKKCGASM